MKKLLVLLALLSPLPAHAQITAASCLAWDIQNGVNTATRDQTITIPSGSCTWIGTNVKCLTSGSNAANSCVGVTITGKGVVLTGAGSTRVIATSRSFVSIGTGTKIFSVLGTGVSCAGGPPCAGTALTFTPPTISGGQTLQICETGFSGGETPNCMTGTVTSFTNPTLTMNITTATGTSGTTTTAPVSAGTNVNIPVVSSAGFIVNSHIRIATPSDFTTINSIPDGTHIVPTLPT